jgi:hypothetical protein
MKEACRLRLRIPVIRVREGAHVGGGSTGRSFTAAFALSIVVVVVLGPVAPRTRGAPHHRDSLERPPPSNLVHAARAASHNGHSPSPTPSLVLRAFFQSPLPHSRLTSSVFRSAPVGCPSIYIYIYIYTTCHRTIRLALYIFYFPFKQNQASSQTLPLASHYALCAGPRSLCAGPRPADDATSGPAHGRQ